MSAKENSKLTSFRKIMVANRGEIAVRILRACGELGITTVAVYSDADRKALHVRYADESFPLGGCAGEGQLPEHPQADRGCAPGPALRAIHPGYGFSCRERGVCPGLPGSRNRLHRPVAGGDPGHG